MSYILEALKKSDQKRKQGEVPDLQTIHIPLSIESQPARWPYVVIVFLLMGLVFMLGWMKPWQSTAVNQVDREADNRVISQPVSSMAVVEEIEAEVRNKQIVAEVSQQVSSESKTERAVVVQAQTPDAAINNQRDIDIKNIPHLDELPELIQKAIPDMAFAGHVYSPNPEQRSVIINGSAMGEGDIIIQGLRIETITRNGVVFEYQSQLFRIDILQDWSFD